MRQLTRGSARLDPARSLRGCVPHLPAPGCPPRRPPQPERPCVPLLDLLGELWSPSRTTREKARPKR